MPNPESVNPSNFKVHHIIYNDDDFSIAYGEWAENGKMVLAMRWNGNDEDAGYPKTFGHPVWFIVSGSLKDIFLNSLLSSPHSNKKNILTIMNE